MKSFKVLLVVFSLFVAVNAVAQIPGGAGSKTDIKKCLKNSVDRKLLDKIVKDMSSQLKNQATETVNKYAVAYASLAAAVASARTTAEGLYKAAEDTIKDGYRDFKDTGKFLSNMKSYSEAKKKQFDEIEKLRTQRRQNLKNTKDPLRVTRFVKDTFSPMYASLAGNVEGIQGSLGALEQGLDDLDGFDAGKKPTPEEIKAAKERLKGTTDSLVAGLTGMLAQKVESQAMMQETNVMLDTLIGSSDITAVENAITREEAKPNSKVSKAQLKEAKEAAADVKAGRRTLQDFRNTMVSTKSEVIEHLQSSLKASDAAAGMLVKATELQSKLGVLNAPFQIGEQVLGLLNGVRAFQGQIAGFMTMGPRIIEAYAQMALSNPEAVFAMLEPELAREAAQILNDIASVASIIDRQTQRLAQLTYLVAGVLPGYIAAYTELLRVDTLLLPATMALQEFNSLIDGGAQAYIMGAAISAAFQMVQPVLQCLAPYMQYMAMAALITGGRLNIAGFLRASSAPSLKRSSRCSKGVMLGNKCTIPKDKRVMRAQAKARSIIRRVSEDFRMANELQLRGVEQMLVQVRGLS